MYFISLKKALYAAQKDKTITALIEDWIDSLEVAFHPLSEARSTQLRCCFSGAFTLPLIPGKFYIKTRDSSKGALAIAIGSSPCGFI